MTQAGAGFDGDTNIVTLLGAQGQEIALPLMTKREVAERVLDAVIQGTEPLPAQTPESFSR